LLLDWEAYIDPEIETIHVTSLAIMKSVFVQVCVNVILLLSWNFVAPLEWTRVAKDATDNFDRSLASYANCTASESSRAFAIVILVVNMGFLIIGTFWAYKSRNITTEYNESLYIGLCIVALLQSWTIGLPILIVVRDNPTASFYVQSGLIFVTSISVVGFIFIPKLIAVRKDVANSRKKVYKDFKRAESLRRRALEEETERDPQHGSDQINPIEIKPKGIKVIHNPRVSTKRCNFCFLITTLTIFTRALSFTKVTTKLSVSRWLGVVEAATSNLGRSM
jgi:7 transmembrane sweet-taste receptor of 3 GCPR